MSEIIPAILEKEFSAIEKKIHLVEKLVHWVQIDIADGILVPNTTFADPTAFRTLQTPIHLEAHLMVKDPIPLVSRYVDAGFKRLYAHVEAENVEGFVSECEKYDVEVGLAIDGPTPYETIHPYLDNIDAVLVMAIKAGFSGQPYRDDTVIKIAKIKETFFELPICVDGAMNAANAAKVVRAGATRINSNSYIFDAPDVSVPITTLKNLI
jgi:ribulose-phosphate 3-epimerase